LLTLFPMKMMRPVFVISEFLALNDFQKQFLKKSVTR
jgi:hypothetical protein